MRSGFGSMLYDERDRLKQFSRIGTYCEAVSESERGKVEFDARRIRLRH